MVPANRDIFITSLNSQRLKDALDNKEHPLLNAGMQQLDVFAFDNLEILNGVFFNESHAGQEYEKIENIISILEDEFVNIDKEHRRMLCESNFKKELKPYIGIVYKEYYSNAAFEKHCKNQIFRNLQPKLRKVSIGDNKSNMLDLLIPFLLTEIALFLYIFSNDCYDNIYGMETEMDIVLAIRGGKYPAFSELFKRNVPYQKIATNA